MNKDYKIYLVDTNGTSAELEIETVDFSTIYSINDLSDITKRKDTITKNIKILGTKNNSRVLGNLANLNRNVSTSSINLNFNFKANNQTDCLIFENNILILKGKLQIIETNKDENDNISFEAVVTGSVINFFNKIQETDLSDLNFGNTTHTYDVGTIKNSWTSTNSPFVYPSIDYGVNPTYQVNFDFRNFRAGIYLKTYLDAIFRTFSYTYSSTFAATSIFQKAYIPHPEKTFSRVINTSYFNATQASFSVSLISTVGRPAFRNPKPITISNAVTNTIITVKNTANDGNGQTFQSFKFNRGVKSDGFVKMNLSSSSSANVKYVVGLFPVKANGSIDFWNPYTQQEFNSNNSEAITLNLPLQDYTIDSEFVIGASITSGGVYSVTINATDIVMQLGTANKSELENLNGDILTIKDCLPQGIKVYDLLKDFLKMFNLMITINPNKPNDFLIEDFATFYAGTINPKETAIDWSNKFNNGAYKSGYNLILPKKYSFKFKEESNNYFNEDYKKKYNENYGDAVYFNTDGYSDESKIEVNFVSTPIVSNSVDQKSMPAIWTGEQTKKESYKSNLRILFNNGAVESNTYNIGIYSTGSTVPYVTGNTTYNGSSHILKDSGGNDIFNLQFGVPKEVKFAVNEDIFTLPNIYTTFYKQQIDELLDPNFSTLECEVWLSETDISNLNFQTPIYLSTEKIGDGYFKLLEVTYKSSLELSKVKLQKILM
jgi:hypothetical protein